MASPAEHLKCEFVSLPHSTTANIDLENTRVVLDGDSVDIQQLTSKKVYGSLITSNAKEPSSKVKFTEYFPDEHLDWKTI